MGYQQIHKYAKGTPSLHTIRMWTEIALRTGHHTLQNSKEKKQIPGNNTISWTTQFLSITVGIAYRQCCASHLDRLGQNCFEHNWLQMSTQIYQDSTINKHGCSSTRKSVIRNCNFIFLCDTSLYLYKKKKKEEACTEMDDVSLEQILCTSKEVLFYI
jgi:hypothetical protein